MDENKQKALDAALGQIERQFGKGSVMRLGDAEIGVDIPAISTGSNSATGVNVPVLPTWIEILRTVVVPVYRSHL